MRTISLMRGSFFSGRGGGIGTGSRPLILPTFLGGKALMGRAMGEDGNDLEPGTKEGNALGKADGRV